MSRLIYADKAIEWIDMEYPTLDRQDMKQMINAQPTAYDIGKVVEQLEELIEKSVGFIRATPEANAYIKAIRDAIEIVEGGAE